ncbi:MAG: ATP-binding protein [Oscillospiraceae bacterium]|nr:ATP-binding protein [Oscillospiraceae bacterium]
MKKILVIYIALALVGIVATFFVFSHEPLMPDVVAIHHAVHTALESDSVQEAVTQQAEFLMQVFEEADTARRNRELVLQIFMLALILSFILIGILLYLYYKHKILTPFRNLQSFAGSVAAGNLDVPLTMDRDNIFGAFTESFDLMREELRTAKENEIKADRSKKELVASLAHDVTTPVASVRSAIDILRLKAQSENEINLLDAANKKLEQIDTLITDLFHSTLEELQELKVTPAEISSVEVSELIIQADYEKRIKPFSIPDCIIKADGLRLQQVFDNIIKNSYKYAGTDIVVNSIIDEEHLFIEIQDFGAGVSEKELPLITGKFYRGKNIEKTDGYGLGLYLSKYFMEQMQGGIYPENCDNGFMIVLTLKFA